MGERCTNDFADSDWDAIMLRLCHKHVVARTETKIEMQPGQFC